MSNPQGPPSEETNAEPVQNDTFTVLNLLLVLVRRRRLIVFTTVIAAVLVVGYNIVAMTIDPESPWNMLPNRYVATVTVMIKDDGLGPGSTANGLSLINSMATNSSLGNFANLMAPSSNTDANVAQELLIGREILDVLAKQQGFTTDESDNGEKFQARVRLKKRLESEYLFESDLVVISYDHLYAKEAASGLSFVVARLRDKMHRLKIDRVSRRKAFLEERISAIELERETAQDAMVAFQQEYGVINLTAQSESAIESLTSLKTNLYQKEVELHSQIELLGDNTAGVKRLQISVNMLRTLIREIEHGFLEFEQTSIPLGELPAIGVKYLNLATELDMHNRIYALLRSQYEGTRIEENAKESVFQIVEPVEVPLQKSRPSRAMICIVGTMAAFIASLLAAFAMEYYKRIESDPAQRQQLEKIRAEIRPVRKRTGL